MSSRLVTEGVWKALTEAARGSSRPALVAVAYFGQGASRLLPLPLGSRLVVDASDGAVKSGQTCPTELKKLLEKGVRIYSAERLHAKVFVIGSRAFIGSANVSGSSASRLVEAILVTSDTTVVAAAKEFVRRLCLHELGPESIDRLSKIYNPPKVYGPQAARRLASKRRGTINLPRVMLAHLVRSNLPEECLAVYRASEKIAKTKLERPRKHRLDDFHWTGECPIRVGDVVVQIVNEGDERRMVSPPGTVIYTRKWRRGDRKRTFVFLELPDRRRVGFDTLARRLGPDAAGKLGRRGKVSRDFAERLLAAWLV